MLHYISSDEGTGTPGDFLITMHIPATHDRISLIAASIPKSYYLINSSDNTFHIGAVTYTIPIGNYSLSKLVAALNTLTTAIFTWAVSSTTSKITVTNATAGQLTMTLNSHIQRLTGFGASTVVAASPGTQTSVNMPNLNRTNQIWILCDQCVDQSALQIGSLLHNCYMSETQPLSYARYDNPAPDLTSKRLITWEANAPANLIKSVTAHYRFFDVTETPIDFNGVSVELVVRTWREENVYDLFWRYAQADMALKNEQRILNREKTMQT